jgi:hypothetical protein
LKRTRILLAGLPNLLEEIVTDILAAAEADGLELIGVARRSAGLGRKVGRLRADVVIIGGDDPSLVAELLEQRPRLKVLSVAADARDSWLYALRSERVHLGGLSADSLVAAVRRSAGAEAHEWWSR